MIDFDQELDTRKLNCPLPVLKTKKVLNNMESGQILRIYATDPGSIDDFESFAEQTGNELLESICHGDEFHFTLKKV